MSCFDRELQARRQKEPALASYRRNAFTDTFVFQGLVKDPERLAQPEGELCRALAADYRRLWSLVAAKQRRPAGRGKDAAPARPLDGEPEFVRASGARPALHLLEHATLTEAALRDSTAGRVRPAFASISIAAMQPDLYRWEDVRFHAQTEPHAPADRASESANGQEAFVGLLAASIGDFKENLLDGRMAVAVGHLGVACHMAQDLVLHHGITRRQLAGLQFFAGRPPSLEASELHAEAKRWTREVIKMAREALGNPAAWERLLGWSPPAGADVVYTSNAIFRDKTSPTNLDIRALARHYVSHLAFRRNPQLAQELDEGPDGLIRWDVADTFARVQRTLENGGIALRSGKSR
jgi:hypothetical protein